MNNDLKYYRVVFDERVYVKDLALLKGLLLQHDQVFNLIFSFAQRQCFSLVRLKTIIFFSEGWILWILTKRIIQIRSIGKKKKNKYRGIGEVQTSDKCSAQQNTSVKRLWVGFYSIHSQELAKLKFSSSQLGIYFFILIIIIFSDCWLEIVRKLNVR